MTKLLRTALLCLPILACPLSAQASKMELRSVTNIGTYTTLRGQYQTGASYSGNQLFRNDQSYSRQSNGPFVTSGFSTALSTLQGFPMISLSSFARVTSPSSGTIERSGQTSTGQFSSWTRSPIMVEGKVWDVPGRDVLVRCNVRAHNLTSQGKAGGYARVDIGGDGTYEVASTWGASVRTQSVATKIPASGVLAIRIEIYGYAAATDATQPAYGVFANATYGYPPRTTATFTRYGTSCGPTTAGVVVDKAVTHEFSVELSGATRSAPGVLLIGSQRYNLAIPGTSCRLHSDAILTLPFFTDAAGRAVRTFPAWSRYSPIKLTFQDVLFLPGFRVATGNGLELETK